MRTGRFLLGLGIIILLVILAAPGVVAQDDHSPLTLALISTDSLFQPLAPGDAPINTNFVRHLDITTDTEQFVIYVAIQNTGWSAGTISIISDALDTEAEYVAVELNTAGGPRTNGFVFPLTYDDEIDDSGGFSLSVLIAQSRALGIFRVVEDGGTTISGFTNAREEGVITQSTVEVTVDLEPVFGPLVLELHIIALPDLPPEPPDDDGDVAPTGDWGACGSCDTCGYAANECVLDPAGECVWNPGSCAVSGAVVGEENSEAECVCLDSWEDCVYSDPYPGPNPGEICQDLTCYDTCGAVCFFLAEAECSGDAIG